MTSTEIPEPPTLRNDFIEVALIPREPALWAAAGE